MPPPLWHPHHGILTYYRYEKSHNFRVNLNRCIPMRPVPRRGTGGARGGFIQKRGFLLKIGLCRNHLYKALSGICEGDPLSPPEGEQPKGACPLDPQFWIIFFTKDPTRSCSTGRAPTRRRAPVASS